MTPSLKVGTDVFVDTLGVGTITRVAFNPKYPNDHDFTVYEINLGYKRIRWGDTVKKWVRGSDVYVLQGEK